MREVEFFNQARPVQERFVNSTLGTGVPVPLLQIAYRSHRPLVWRLLAVIALIVALGLAAIGFGKLESSIGIAPQAMIPVYGAFLAFAVWCLLRAAGLAEDLSKLPYRAGIYLFPVGLIDARLPRFRIIPLDELEKTQHVPGSGKVEVTFKGGRTFVFPIGDKSQADALELAIADARARLEKLATVNDRRAMAALDPLQDNGFSNPFTTSEKLAPKVPLLKRQLVTIPLAALVGLVLGAGLWAARNWRSEQHLFIEARQRDTVDAYLAYLKRSGARPEVRELLLPRAELRQAQAAGSVAALEAFMASHPGTQIEPEVAVALRGQLVKELNAAATPGSLETLRKFKEEFPRHEPVAQDLQRYIDGVRDLAVTRFKREASSADGVPQFFEKLARYTTLHGPKVLVRFRRLPSDSLELADKAVKRSTYYGGSQMLPSQYFGDAYASRREQATGTTIVERLQRAWPADVMRFELGPVLEGEPPATPDVPTLLIEERVQLSGAYLSTKPRGAWAGAGMLFKATFQIPAEKDGLEFKHSTWRPPSPLVLLKKDAKIEELYEDMAQTAYERFLRKFLALIFVNP